MIKSTNLIVLSFLLFISFSLLWNSSLSNIFVRIWAQSDEPQITNRDIGEMQSQAQEYAKKLRETRAVKVPNQYIVVLKDGNLSATSLRDSVEEAKNQGAAVRHIYEKAIKGFTVRVPNERALVAILKNPRVEFVEPDTKVMAFAQTLPTGINRVDGDLSITKSGDGFGSVNVDVAVLDTGIDLNHPDLNVYKHTTFVDGTSSGNDDQGHGTRVAGIVGAKDDSQGVVGLAPGARLWSVKVLDNNGQGFVSDIIAGIDYVTSNAGSIDVANLSFGGPGPDSALQTAIKNSVNAGVTYVAAAGNENTDAGSVVPASFPEVIAVSAIVDRDGKCGALAYSPSYGKDDSLASFSNYGSVVDLAAPGVSIQTTARSSTYGSFTGTSASSPHVAGAAALHIAQHPDATSSDVRTALRASGSVPSTACDGKGHGYFTGDRDSVAEPLLYMASGGASSSTDTTPPTVTSTTPGSGATAIAVTSTITAKFSEKVQSSTVTTSTVKLKDSAGNSVSGTVSLDGDQLTATFKPSSSLAYSTSYTATISPSGTAAVKDLAGNSMATKSWSFTTAAAPGVTNPPSSCGSNLPITGVTARSSQSSFGPANAIDNNFNTKWWSTFSANPWIKADLGAQKTICSVNIAWADGASRQYSFVISTSTDGTSFTNAFTGKSKGTTTSAEKYTFPDKQARYVRITITQSHAGTSNSLAQISELDIFGVAAAATSSGTANTLRSDSGLDLGPNSAHVANENSDNNDATNSQSQTQGATKAPMSSVEKDRKVSPSLPATTLSNQPPIAKDDRARSESVNEILVKVLRNDRDPDGDQLDIVSVSSPTKNAGIVIINNNGTLTYVPEAHFAGVDTFTYEISDGKSKSDKAKVSVIVKPLKEYIKSGNADRHQQTENVKKLQDGTREDGTQSQSKPDSLRLNHEGVPVRNNSQNNSNNVIIETPSNGK